MKKVLLALAAVSCMASYASAQEAKKETWSDKLTLKGDLRYRYEYIDQEGKTERTRNRIRARVGLEAKPSDEVKVGVGLSTSEGGDPVSSNQTLGDGGSRKDIYFDYAYLSYSPVEVKGLKLTGGKMHNPFYMPADLVFDGDLNPEGVALQYTLGVADGFDLSVNGGYIWLEERSSDEDDAMMTGAQLVAALKTEGMTAKFGAGLYTFNNVEGYGLLVDETKAYGNDTVGGEEDLVTGEESPLLYATGFDIMDLAAEIGLNVGIPVKLYGDYAVNNDADADDTGYMAGIKLGATKEPGSVSLDYNYRELEANAVLGAWTDSDFIGGGTDGKGHKISLAVQLTKVLTGAVTYFKNDKGLENSKDYDRLQVDVSAKF